MSKLHIDITTSLDGFVAAANRTAEEPMGRDGERLHNWTFAGDDEDRAVLESGISSVGAVVCGRRTYDDSVRWWQENGPTGPARVPVVVITHEPPDEVLANSVYHFANGFEAALRSAKDLAEGRDVVVMGGASTVQQALRSGLADSISLHVAPILLGTGLRLFDEMPDQHRTLIHKSTVSTPSAIHIRYDLQRE